MKKKALIIVSKNGFLDEEYFLLYKRFVHEGISITVGSQTKGKVEGVHGIDVRSELSLGEVKSADFDIIIFLQGPGIWDMAQEDVVYSLIHRFKDEDKILAASGNAVILLANAGALMGKRVTGDHSIEESIINKGGDYTGMPLEQDGNIITSKDVESVGGFLEKILWTLGDN